jgi:hypothetical protein
LIVGILHSNCPGKNLNPSSFLPISYSPIC